MGKRRDGFSDMSEDKMSEVARTSVGAVATGQWSSCPMPPVFMFSAESKQGGWPYKI